MPAERAQIAIEGAVPGVTGDVEFAAQGARDQALEAVKSYRVPGRYRMAMALKAQFSDSVEDDAKFVASAKAMFEKMDIDKGGTINKDEMIAGLAERGLTLSEAAANDLMASVDEDGSGEVSL